MAELPPDPAAAIFREGPLTFVTDPRVKEVLRDFAEQVYQELADHATGWPEPNEGIFRASIRSAIADLRHAQLGLLEWSHPDANLRTQHERWIAKLAAKLAQTVEDAAQLLERELGTWRGEEPYG